MLQVFNHQGGIIVYRSADEVSVGATAAGSSIEVWGNVTSSLSVSSNHSGILTVYGSIPGAQLGWGTDGSIYVGQAVGPITFDGPLSGGLTINSDLTSSVVVGAGADGGDLTGTIQINGGLGSLENPITDLSGGYIIVNGSFENPGHISVDTLDPNTTAFIAIDYTGWQEGHNWGSNDPGDHDNPYVTVYSASPSDQYGNTPALHVWHISKCKADMNGDGTVSFADLDPFVEAQGSLAAYALTYPGLGGVAPNPGVGGSAVFHGDLTCDGVFSFADINPFVRRLGCPGYCDPNCGPFRMDPEPLPLPPQELAVQLMLNIEPRNFAGLVDIADRAARGLDTAAARVYWRAVHRYLTQ